MERFISYAEYGEDLILHNVLKDIGDKIFWIDAGASDPWEYSVTQYFYLRGGTGINIEPRIEAFKDIEAYRPRDINVNCGVGDKAGTLKFCLEATSASEEVIKRYEKNGKKLEFREVPIRTLNSILEEYKIDCDIHLLKIDVEGMELSVLKGLDLKKYRPWIMCIETCMDSQTDMMGQIEKLLNRNGYIAVLEDSINKWYLANEHSDLQERFFGIEELKKNIDLHYVRRDELIQKLLEWNLEGNAYYKLGKVLAGPFAPTVKFFLSFFGKKN